MKWLFNNVLQEASTVEEREDTARYFPAANGRYEVKPGLLAFGTCMGNGQFDRKVFQIDSSFAQYRQAKLSARAERLEKYYQTCNYSAAVASAITSFIIHRLTQEHPEMFCLEQKGDGIALHCSLTGESLYFDAQLQLQQVDAQYLPVSPPYLSALDALAGQVQEDLAVVCRSESGIDWLSTIHLCCPNHWAAEEKIGRSFASVHAPVADMQGINQRATAIVNVIIERGPFVRFAWGLGTDTRLNHHPNPPPNIPMANWQGRCFNKEHPQLYMRIERQVLWGFPAYDSALFTIRTYFRDCSEIKKDAALRVKLTSAIESMSCESLVYKGLAESKNDILEWLNDI